MTKFEECKTEWLKYALKEKVLTSEIVEKIKMVLEQQKEIGVYFPFPRYEKIEEMKKHHWFFHKIESYSTLECPCCRSLEISDYYLKIGCDYLDVYECPLCNYFSINRHITFPNYTIHSYLSSLHSLRIFNSQLNKHLKKFDIIQESYIPNPQIKNWSAKYQFSLVRDYVYDLYAEIKSIDFLDMYIHDFKVSG